MKSGTGDDPFADDPEEEPADEQSTDTDQLMDTTPDTPTDDQPVQEFPYVMERNTVKEGRDEVRQFFLREEAAEGEKQLIRELEDELGTDVAKLDVREAAYLFAQRHPGEVAEILREWGYEYR